MDAAWNFFFIFYFPKIRGKNGVKEKIGQKNQRGKYYLRVSQCSPQEKNNETEFKLASPLKKVATAPSPPKEVTFYQGTPAGSDIVVITTGGVSVVDGILP